MAEAGSSDSNMSTLSYMGPEDILAIGTASGLFVLWDLERVLQLSIRGFGSPVTQILARRGRWYVLTGDHVFIFHGHDIAEPAGMIHTGQSTYMIFLGETIITGHVNHIRRWNLDDGSPAGVVDSGNTVFCMAALEDIGMVFSGHAGGFVRSWTIEDGEWEWVDEYDDVSRITSIAAVDELEMKHVCVGNEFGDLYHYDYNMQMQTLGLRVIMEHEYQRRKRIVGIHNITNLEEKVAVTTAHTAELLDINDSRLRSIRLTDPSGFVTASTVNRSGSIYIAALSTGVVMRLNIADIDAEQPHHLPFNYGHINAMAINRI